MPESRPRTRFIFVTGGVVSSLGKGIAAASIGRLLVSRGLKVALQKFDPYINVDPGTMSPFQHGEVFVTEDGAETDLDLGHYERFTDANTSRGSNVTAGARLQQRHPQGAPRRLPRRHRPGRAAHHRRDQAPHQADRREPGRRRRDHRDRRHGGRHRVAAVPGGDPAVPRRRRAPPLHVHPPDAGALHRPRGRAEDQADPALGQRAAPHRHPARHGRLRARRAACRTTIRKKIALFASLPAEAIVSACDVDNIYKVPLNFRDEGVDDFVLEHFGMEDGRAPDLAGWERLVDAPPRSPTADGADRARRQVRQARGRLPLGRRGAPPRRLPARLADRHRLGRLGDARRRRGPRAASRGPTACCPGRLRRPRDRGQDHRRRGSPASRRSRTSASAWACRWPCAEFARHVAGMDGANSTEFDPETPFPVIDLLPEQKEVADMGGTMRLGADPVKLHDEHAGARAVRRGGRLRAPPPPLRGQQLPAQAARGRRPGHLGHVARRAPRRDHRARPTTRSSSRRSSTRSSSRGRSGRRRCSASSSAPR